MGRCSQSLVCGFVSLVIEGDRPACDYFTAKGENLTPVCSNCLFWIEDN